MIRDIEPGFVGSLDMHVGAVPWMYAQGLVGLT